MSGARTPSPAPSPATAGGYQMAFNYGDEGVRRVHRVRRRARPRDHRREHLRVARRGRTGLSHTSWLKLVKILGPTYTERIVSAENVVNDFLVRRTVREVAEQINNLETARQLTRKALARIEPRTDDDRRDHHLGPRVGLRPPPGRIQHRGTGAASASTTRRSPKIRPTRRTPATGSGTRTTSFQRGDFFAFNVGGQLHGLRNGHQDPRLHPARGRDRASGRASRSSSISRSPASGSCGPTCGSA